MQEASSATSSQQNVRIIDVGGTGLTDISDNSISKSNFFRPGGRLFFQNKTKTFKIELFPKEGDFFLATSYFDVLK